VIPNVGNPRQTGEILIPAGPTREGQESKGSGEGENGEKNRGVGSTA